MSAELTTMLATVIAGRAAEMNGSGLISSCPMKILTRSQSQTLRWSTWLAVVLHWQTTESGSRLSLQMKENPSVAPSTDPILTVEGILLEYPAIATTYAMQSLLGYISWTITWGGISVPTPLRMLLKALPPVSDSATFGIVE